MFKRYSSRLLVTCLLSNLALLSAELQARSLSELAQPVTEQGTYRNAEYGFAFSYPQGMAVTPVFVGHYLVPADSWRIVAAEANGKPVISVVVYRPNGEQAYPDVEVRIGVRAGNSAEEACQWTELEQQLNPLGTVELAGVEFKTFDLSDAAMQQSLEGVSYQTYHNGYCYAIERFLTDSIYVEDEAAAIKAKQRQEQISQAHYAMTEAIVQSFRFLD